MRSGKTNPPRQWNQQKFTHWSLQAKATLTNANGLAKTLADAGEQAAVITLPDSICWLLNVRGGDIERNPVVHGFAVLHADGSVDLVL